MQHIVNKCGDFYGFALDALLLDILVSAGCDLKEVVGLSAETEAFSAILNSW